MDVDGTTNISADLLEIRKGASAFGVAFNSLLQPVGTIRGAQTPALTLPLQSPSCTIPPPSCGGPSVVVERDRSLTLAPGAYGSLSVRNAGTVSLSPGTFQFCSIEVGRNAAIEATGPVTMNVEGPVRFRNGSHLTVAPGASRPMLHVAGDLVRFSRHAEATAFLRAPDARVELGNGARFDGTACGVNLRSGRRAILTCRP